MRQRSCGLGGRRVQTAAGRGVARRGAEDARARPDGNGGEGRHGWRWWRGLGGDVWTGGPAMEILWRWPVHGSEDQPWSRVAACRLQDVEERPRARGDHAARTLGRLGRREPGLLRLLAVRLDVTTANGQRKPPRLCPLPLARHHAFPSFQPPSCALELCCRYAYAYRLRVLRER